MQKINIENPLGLKVYINGIPDITQIPNDEFDRIISMLEMQISNDIKSECSLGEAKAEESINTAQ